MAYCALPFFSFFCLFLFLRVHFGIFFHFDWYLHLFATYFSSAATF